jgi:hypothetical protein
MLGKRWSTVVVKGGRESDGERNQRDQASHQQIVSKARLLKIRFFSHEFHRQRKPKPKSLRISSTVVINYFSGRRIVGLLNIEEWISLKIFNV